MANFYSVLGDTEIDTSKAEASLDRLQRRIRQTGQAGAQAGQTASESFGELNSVFGGLLPRNMQSIVRRFQSTSRAVRRAGRSMSFFKKTLVSLGLPALIIVVGELIANWEKFTDLLDLTFLPVQHGLSWRPPLGVLQRCQSLPRSKILLHHQRCGPPWRQRYQCCSQVLHSLRLITGHGGGYAVAQSFTAWRCHCRSKKQ